MEEGNGADNPRRADPPVIEDVGSHVPLLVGPAALPRGQRRGINLDAAARERSEPEVGNQPADVDQRDVIMAALLREVSEMRREMSEIRRARAPVPPVLPVDVPPLQPVVPPVAPVPVVAVPVREQGSQFRTRELMKYGAEFFKGATDPLEAEDWLEHVERILGQMHANDAQKVEGAVSLLQSDAYNWWKTVPDYDTLPPVFTWAQFKELFNDKYVPQVYRDQKLQEFLDLRQGGMSVNEYEVKFLRLSRYARRIIETEQERMQRFEKGLVPKLELAVSSGHCTTFVELVNFARKQERILARNIEESRTGFNQGDRQSKKEKFHTGPSP